MCMIFGTALFISWRSLELQPTEATYKTILAAENKLGLEHGRQLNIRRISLYAFIVLYDYSSVGRLHKKLITNISIVSVRHWKIEGEYSLAFVAKIFFDSSLSHTSP